MLALYARTWQGVPLGADEYVVSAAEKTSAQARCRCHPTLASTYGIPVEDVIGSGVDGQRQGVAFVAVPDEEAVDARTAGGVVVQPDVQEVLGGRAERDALHVEPVEPPDPWMTYARTPNQQRCSRAWARASGEASAVTYAGAATQVVSASGSLPASRAASRTALTAFCPASFRDQATLDDGAMWPTACALMGGPRPTKSASARSSGRRWTDAGRGRNGGESDPAGPVAWRAAGPRSRV